MDESGNPMPVYHDRSQFFALASEGACEHYTKEQCEQYIKHLNQPEPDPFATLPTEEPPKVNNGCPWQSIWRGSLRRVRGLLGQVHMLVPSVRGKGGRVSGLQ